VVFAIYTIQRFLRRRRLELALKGAVRIAAARTSTLRGSTTKSSVPSPSSGRPLTSQTFADSGIPPRIQNTKRSASDSTPFSHQLKTGPDLRPSLSGDGTRFTYFAGAKPIAESSSPNIKNRSHTITAFVEQPGDGVLVAAGGVMGGYALFVKDRMPTYEYNWFGHNRYRVTSSEPLPPGQSTIRVEFNTMAAVWRRAATSRCSSTTRRSPREEWKRRLMVASPLKRRLTPVSVLARPSAISMCRRSTLQARSTG
jgi:hypothetical protein